MDVVRRFGEDAGKDEGEGAGAVLYVLVVDEPGVRRTGAGRPSLRGVGVIGVAETSLRLVGVDVGVIADCACVVGATLRNETGLGGGVAGMVRDGAVETDWATPTPL